MFSFFFNRLVHFKYAKTLYVMYQVRISTLAEPEITTICKSLKRIKYNEGSSEDGELLKVGTTLFELYLVLQRFVM